ncbi:hypothetical protein D9M70_647120 [compost metagenome]
MLRPEIVFNTIGKSVKTVRPNTADGAPMPRNDIASASTASVGIVVPRLINCVMASACGASGLRVSAIPSGKPIATAMATE